MKSNDIVKFFKEMKGIRLSSDSKILIAGLVLLIGIDRGCSTHQDADTTEIDREIAAAQLELRDANARYQESAVARDMYKHKCDSLTPVFGAPESASERARKDAQWRQYRDSVSKYNDRTIDLEIARDWAKLRVDRLVSERKIQKMR